MAWSLLTRALTHRSPIVRLTTAVAVGALGFALAWTVAYAGLPELVAYLVLATVLANASLWRQQRITDRHLIRIRRLRDIRLTRVEFALVGLSFALLGGAAMLETAQIAALQSL